MKKPILPLIYCLILIFSSQSLVAQDSDLVVKEKYSEFGINATGFINEFISLNSNNSDIGDYMITYKYHMGPNALRVGVGGRFSQVDENVEGGGSRVTKNNDFDFRVGYEMNKEISRRWSVYMGVDAIAGFAQSESTTTNFEEVTITKGETFYGGGPVFGVQFFINSHISLATETSLYYKHSVLSNKQDFSINTEFNIDESSTDDELKFGLPTSLFFVIRF